MHWVKVMDIPFGKLKDKGTPIDNISKYDSKSEHFIYVCAMEPLEGTKLLFGTKTAMLKIVDGNEFIVGKKTTAATKLSDGDEVLLVCRAESTDTIVMRSKKEVFLRISCEQIPEKKKGAVGVRGMKLDKDDELSDIYYLKDGDNENVEVRGKEIALNRLHIGNRDTKGVKR
jgi:DNA gyrase subunit A